MNVGEGLTLAFAGLSANRLRSTLTMLGILIGVAAVILLVAFGNGTSVAVQKQVESLGSNVIYVFPSSSRTSGVAQGFGTAQTLSQDDVTALNDHSQAPDIVTAIPLTTAAGTMTYQNQNWSAPASGSTQDWAQVRNYDLSAGAFFSAGDVRSSARVVVLGQTVVDNLFGGDSSAAVDKSIKIQRQSFRVVGVLAAKGSGGLGNQDNVAVVPISTAWNYLTGGRGKNINQIIIQASSSDATSAAQSEATQILLNRHRISDPTQADFQMQSQQDLLNSFGQITGLLTVLLGSIAAISLVVGGIGIMNIMLVTVTERTREIGIRKAVGARRRDVLVQFLIESMFLSGLGGLLGILLGAGLAVLVASFAVSSGSSQIPPPVVSTPSVVLAFGVSVAIGLFFGIYPANRAASINPIDALRYE
ncbi:MAG: ABC transporter permease [Candidatus Dormibacteraeota bacterium]|uniref:ABC transporter permease n=1 Tax=Candidatus Dormiibacter inghamiae TaxID=3127013 RepID=A0A934NI03_9BACT|nr:ABC transporter permease [Candidatus Dormibacteraeota bacterium]MBJ7606330.1 ABC transporter permease [Candidatus Dormibacteraeota bacterium]